MLAASILMQYTNTHTENIMKRTIKITAVSFGLCILGFFPSISVNAALISTDAMVSEVKTSISREQILTAISREEVSRVLVAKGVDMAAAHDRIQAMTDQEIAVLQQDIEALPAGAGTGSVLVTIVLVLVILDIVGVTNVFTFIR